MTTDDVSIRVYEASDKQRFLEIYDAVMPQSHHFLDKETLLRQRIRVEESLEEPTSEIFVLEKGEKVVGFATFVTETAMAEFFIDSQFQKQGLGGKLMNYIQKNKPKICLVVYKRNRNAVKFYRHKGFQIQSQEREKPQQPLYFEMQWKA